MNPMMAALQKSRADNPVSSSVQMPGKPVIAKMPGNPGDMPKMMADINSKLDKLLQLIGGNEPEKMEKEAPNGNGSGY